MRLYVYMAASLALVFAASCTLGDKPFLSRLHADADTPLYTTYAAVQQRSHFLLDEGYHLRYDDPDLPLALVTDNAGEWSFYVIDDARTPENINDYKDKPVITLSYPDQVHYRWQPLEGVNVETEFVVHSSRLTVQEVTVQNLSRQPRTVQLASVIRANAGRFTEPAFGDEALDFQHRESPDFWTVRHRQPHVEEVQDLFAGEGDLPLEPFALRTFHSVRDLFPAGKIGDPPMGQVDAVGLRTTLELKPRAKRKFRFVRGVAPAGEDISELREQADHLLRANLSVYQRQNELLFSRVPELQRGNADLQTLYHSAWSMMRQMMMPAEGACATNYYLFSREPTWGWGHGGQVFHESLTMLVYGRLDPEGAMNSQRVFSLRQKENGYINYRTGPYLDEQIITNGEPTSSAPWYAWENWELYRLTRDRLFLEQMYASSRRFHDWFIANRDADNDGLCEWGGHAILESVRDASAVVWDEVAWPAEFDALDLNCMLVMEERSLAAMASELNLSEEAQRWRMASDGRAGKIRRTMWDEESGFFYNVDRRDDDFSYAKPGDLKRLEIIGFLPLWAGVATDKQAGRLVQEHLLNPAEFWRPYGVPSLAANDPSYDPKGYWNGPVWVQWNDLIVRGLLDYGFTREARELTQRVASGMIETARTTHTLWEFYSPEEPWGGWHQTYIWAGMINDMLLLTQDVQ